MPDIEAHRGGSRQWRPSSDRPDTLPPLQLPIISKPKNIPTFCRERDIFTWLCNQVSRHTPIVSSHHILSGSPIYPKIAPHKFPPFPIDPKIGPSDREMFGAGFYFTRFGAAAHFGLNSGANVLSVWC